MGKKRQSRDQKRKAKLAKREKKNPTQSDLVYTGERYRSDELLPVVQAVETGICQAYVMTGRTMTDNHVRTALETLITQMRQGTLPAFAHSCSAKYEAGKEAELAIWAIRHEWHHLFDHEAHPGNDNVIGVMRTLLGSLDTFGNRSKESRGYLNFVEGFLARAGVTFTELGEEEDPFYADGLFWLEENDTEARQDFLQEAERLIGAGEGIHVAEVCNRLLGAASETPYFAEISRLAHRAAEGPLLPPPAKKEGRPLLGLDETGA